MIPPAPGEPGRRVDFTVMRSSKAPEGFSSDALVDNNLGTSWVSREQEGAPIQIEFGLPEAAGVCIKKIGFVSGVFGNPSLAKQVTSPIKMKVSHLQKVAKGKKAPKNEATAELTPTEGSTEIQWLSVPEVCQVTRTTITIEKPTGDIPDIAIAELYVIAE